MLRTNAAAAAQRATSLTTDGVLILADHLQQLHARMSYEIKQLQQLLTTANIITVWTGTRSSATADGAEIARDADDVNFKHSTSLKVISCCANRRGIYDFLSALNRA